MTPLVVVRHARAGRRQAWKGDDRLRPLSGKGQSQADRMVGLLTPVLRRAWSPASVILTSPWVRCHETVMPLAEKLDARVELSDALGEGMGSKAVDLVAGLAGEVAVLCTHGDVVGEILAWLQTQGIDLGNEPVWPKGSAWILQARGGVLRSARYLPPPP